MKKHLITLCVSALFAAILVYSCSGERPYAQAGPASETLYDPNPAMNNPDKFAWELFVKICQPLEASNPEGKIVWESWISAITLFANPEKIGEWDTPELKRASTAKGFSETTSTEEIDQTPLQLQRLGIPAHSTANLKSGSISTIISETRLNKALYDFIKTNDLYYQEAIEDYLNRHGEIQTPIESMEIKASWNLISEEEKERYHYRYFTGKNGKSELRGLTGLHLISKDLPQWTWATFEHKDNVDLAAIERLFPYLKSVDRFGKNADGEVSGALKALFQQAGMHPKWENYTLRGTQINYTDNKGNATLLGNTQLENSFMLSASCITCHSAAAYGGTMEFADLPDDIQRLIRKGDDTGLHYFNSPVFGQKNPRPRHPQYDAFLTLHSSPQPDSFIQRGRISNRLYTYNQLDFVWSFSRAKRRIPYQAP